MLSGRYIFLPTIGKLKRYSIYHFIDTLTNNKVYRVFFLLKTLYYSPIIYVCQYTLQLYCEVGCEKSIKVLGLVQSGDLKQENGAFKSSSDYIH